MAMNYAFEMLGTVQGFLASDCECTLDETKSAEITAALEAASDVIAKITGGRVRGRRTSTVWPIRQSGSCIGMSTQTMTLIDLDAIPIPGILPVIDEVRIDGAVLGSGEYKMFNGPNLVRLAGDWPYGNNLRSASNAEVGTFTVTYTHGDNGGLLGVKASYEIACSLIQKYIPGFGRGVTSASVQGVSLTIDEAADEIRQGGDSYPNVQRLLASFAPGGAGLSSVWSPELSLGWELVTRT